MEEDTQPNKKKIIIIVVGVIALIAVIFAVTQYGLTPADETAAATTLETRIGTLETWKATTAETISNIQIDIDGIEAPPSYSGDIDALHIELEALKNDILNLSFQTVTVTRIEADTGFYYVDVTAYQEGNYPIVLNLYGSDLTNVEARFPTAYTVSLWGGNSTITAIIVPVTTWSANYVVELKAVGTVEYGCAFIGASETEPEVIW